VLGRHAGTYPVTRGWLSVTGIGGHGSATAGFLIAVFMFTGWDGTLYVNEEVRHRRRNPGKAAIIAVVVLAVLYAFTTIGLQGVVAPGKLQANSASALAYIAQALGGSGWAKVMALGLALSVVATTGTGIVLTARIVYGMASYRVLPEFLANVSVRFKTPVAASVIAGLAITGLAWVYLLATSVQNAFNDVVAVTGLLFGMFYILTALATIIYYRRRLTRPRDAMILGVLPVAAAGFLGWVVVKSMLAAPASQLWSLAGIVGSGLVVMVAARIFLRPQFFRIRREADTQASLDATW
jgi:amino acid transporter